MNISITVNGASAVHDVEPRQLLVHFIRDDVGLKGTNVGCDTSSCGACTVLLNGQSVKSCTVLAVQADGQSVTTIEGLEGNLCRCTGYHNIVQAVLAAAQAAGPGEAR